MNTPFSSSKKPLRWALGAASNHTQASRSTSGTSLLWPSVFGALAGILATIIIFAPASWFTQLVATLSNERVVLTDARGTVWNGSARLLLTGGSGTQDAILLPERVNWTTMPHGLGLRTQMLLTCCSTQPVRITMQPGLREHHILFEQVNLALPAGVLTGLGTPFNTLAFQGQIRINSDKLRIQVSPEKTQIEGHAQMDLLDMSSRLATLPSLGSYRLQLVGSAATNTIALTTLSGALIMNGNGQWEGRRLRFNGTASAAPGSEAALGNVLNIIGRREGERSLIKI